MAKRIGIIGSGVKRADLSAKTGGQAKIASFEETARSGEIVVIATKGSAAENAVTLAGVANLAGKVVIDTTNPIADAPPVNGVLKFFTTLDDSCARHRAVVHAVVHPRLPEQQLGARLQALEIATVAWPTLCLVPEACCDDPCPYARRHARRFVAVRGDHQARA